MGRVPASPKLSNAILGHKMEDGHVHMTLWRYAQKLIKHPASKVDWPFQRRNNTGYKISHERNTFLIGQCGIQRKYWADIEEFRTWEILFKSEEIRCIGLHWLVFHSIKVKTFYLVKVDWILILECLSVV